MDNSKSKEKENKGLETGNEARRINPHVKAMSEDHLYHIALSNKAYDLEEMFGDVRIVCFGGQASRMKNFAKFIASELGMDSPEVTSPRNFADNTDRYAVYKAGPVLAVSHGIGIPSLSIVFQEIVKLLFHAKCRDVVFFRIGTCGGIGVPGGTVVISEKVVNGALQPAYQALVLGQLVDRPAVVDRELANQLYACAKKCDEFETVLGTTLCADDFYEGQGRIDGAFCDHDDQAKLSWLHELSNHGVINMEMESLGFITMCHRAGIRGAVVCVCLLDRFNGDGITTDRDLLQKWQTFPQILVSRYIRQELGIDQR